MFLHSTQKTSLLPHHLSNKSTNLFDNRQLIPKFPLPQLFCIFGQNNGLKSCDTHKVLHLLRNISRTANKLQELGHPFVISDQLFANYHRFHDSNISLILFDIRMLLLEQCDSFSNYYHSIWKIAMSIVSLITFEIFQHADFIDVIVYI